MVANQKKHSCELRDVAHYLKNTNHTLTEVAFANGFVSTSNRNDFCKDYLLDTPSEIRRKAQKQENVRYEEKNVKKYDIMKNTFGNN